MPDEYKDKISDEDKKSITDAVEEAKKHQASEDKEELEAAAKALNDAIMPIGAKMYAQSKDEAPVSEDGEKKEDEAVEGEVVNEEEAKEEPKE
jgi:molecular chaperone DnaK